MFGSYSEGAPGPDGIFFCHVFWDIIKYDLCRLFDAWYRGDLNIFRLNFATITLIPKESNARSMNKFRPISLHNYCFKIFTKVLTNRLPLIISRLIFQHHFAFVRGRFILENVVTAHEIIHSVHSSGQKGLVFKIDYEKAYDKVCLDFLYEILSLRGFIDKWIGWIRKLTQGGYVGIKILGEESGYLPLVKG